MATPHSEGSGLRNPYPIGEGTIRPDRDFKGFRGFRGFRGFKGFKGFKRFKRFRGSGVQGFRGSGFKKNIY